MSTRNHRIALTVACVLLVAGVAVPASASGVDLAGDESTVDDTVGDTIDETVDGVDSAEDGASDATDSDGAGEAAESDEESNDTAAEPVASRADTVESTLDSVGSTAESVGSTAESVEANASADLGIDATVDAEVGNESVHADASANATTAAADSGLDATANLTGNATGNLTAADASTDLGVGAGATVAPNGTYLDASAGVNVGTSLTATAVRSTASTNRSREGAIQAQREGEKTTRTALPGGDERDRQTGADGSASSADPANETGPGSSIPAGPTAAVGVGLAGCAIAARSGLSATGGLQAVGETAAATDPRAGARAALEWTRSRLPRILPLGYSRHDDSDPLEHEVRASLYETVERAPGVHLSALADGADVSMSSVRHHLRILEAESLVETERINGKRRFFPAGTGETALLAALDGEATAAVLRAVARREPASVSALAEALDRDPSTVSHHLSSLADDGLVERERDGRAVRTRLAPEVRVALDAAEAGPGPATAD